jgi:outer membrane murein-binding lipoprotein Lpp
MAEESARIGRPPEFTTEQIVAAGKRIVTRNQAVNGFRLRSELGGGKASRLMEVWTRHENELIDASAKRIDDLPFELAPHAESVAELASIEARTNIQKLYRAIYSEINGRLNAQFKKELEMAKDVAVCAEDQIEKTDERLAVANAEIDRLTTETRRLSELTARLEERSMQLERVVEAARAEARQAHLDAMEMVAAARTDAGVEKARSATPNPEPVNARPPRSRN